MAMPQSTLPRQSILERETACATAEVDRLQKELQQAKRFAQSEAAYFGAPMQAVSETRVKVERLRREWWEACEDLKLLLGEDE